MWPTMALETTGRRKAKRKMKEEEEMVEEKKTKKRKAAERSVWRAKERERESARE